MSQRDETGKKETSNAAGVADNPRRLWSDQDETPLEEARRTSPAMRSQELEEPAGNGSTSRGGEGNSLPAAQEPASEVSSQVPSQAGGEGDSGSAGQEGGQTGSSQGRDDEGEQKEEEDKKGQEEQKKASWKIFEDVMLWAAWLIMVAFNGYAEVFKLNGTTTGSVARQVNIWIMPAGYVFAIWGLIYIALGVWLVRFCLAGPSRKKLGFLPFTLSGLIFVATCCLNIAWLVFWHRQQGVISLIIIALLTLLVWILYALVRRDATQAGTPLVAKVLDWAPLSLYASWLSVATIINAVYAILSSHLIISDLLQGFSLIIIVGLLLVLSFLMMQKLKDWVFGLVVIWACLGIGIRLFSFTVPLSVLTIALTAIGALIIYFPWNRFTLTRR